MLVRLGCTGPSFAPCSSPHCAHPPCSDSLAASEQGRLADFIACSHRSAAEMPKLCSAIDTMTGRFPCTLDG